MITSLSICSFKTLLKDADHSIATATQKFLADLKKSDSEDCKNIFEAIAIEYLIEAINKVQALW